MSTTALSASTWTPGGGVCWVATRASRRPIGPSASRPRRPTDAASTAVRRRGAPRGRPPPRGRSASPGTGASSDRGGHTQWGAAEVVRVVDSSHASGVHGCPGRSGLTRRPGAVTGMTRRRVDMGKLTYDSTLVVDFDDRVLAHLQVVIGAKLRRNESFYFSWRDDSAVGDGRSVIWLHPSIALMYKFHG